MILTCITLLLIGIFFILSRYLLALRLNKKRVFTDTYVYLACKKLSSNPDQVFPPCDFTLPRVWMLILSLLGNHNKWPFYSNFFLFISILLFSAFNHSGYMLVTILLLSTPFLWHNVFGAYALSARPLGFCFTLLGISYQTLSLTPYFGLEYSYILIIIFSIGWLLLLVISSEISKFAYQSLFVVSWVSIYTLIPSLLLALYIIIRIANNIQCKGFLKSLQGHFSHSLFYYKTLQHRFPLLNNRRTYITDIMSNPFKFFKKAIPSNEFFLSNVALRFMILMPSIFALAFLDYGRYLSNPLFSQFLALIIASFSAYVITSFSRFRFLGEPDRYLCNIALPSLCLLLVGCSTVILPVVFVNVIITYLMTYKLFIYSKATINPAPDPTSVSDALSENLINTTEFSYIGYDNILETMKEIDYFISHKRIHQKIVCMPYNVDTEQARKFWHKYLINYPFVDIQEINASLSST